MTTIDLIILLAVAVGALRGFFTGLVRQVIGLAGLIVAFVLALELMPLGARIVGPMLRLGDMASNVAGFLLVFLAVELLVIIVTRLSEMITGVLRLTLVNRAAGSIFGALKTLLLLSIALVLLARMGIPSSEQQRASLLYSSTAMIVPSAWDLLAEVWPRVETVSARFGDEVRSYWNAREAAIQEREP